MSKEITRCISISPARRAAAIVPAAGPDSMIRTGKADASCTDVIPVRHHDEGWALEPLSETEFGKSEEIVADDRLNIAVDHGG
jgi:hypothetical protein